MTNDTPHEDATPNAVRVTITDEAWNTLWGYPRLIGAYVTLLREIERKQQHPLSAYVFDLADELGVHRSTMSEYLIALDDLGLIERQSQFVSPRTGETSTDFSNKRGFVRREANLYTIKDMK